MHDLETLAKLFDLLSGFEVPTQRPTEASIARINEHFGVELPANFIRFAKFSECYGSWFAGLGEDYQNEWHIIRINSFYRRLRRRKHGDKWRSAKPKAYVVINHGHDDDCDCIDTSDWNEDAGEYRIGYWTPGLERIDEPYDSFLAYLNGLVKAHLRRHTNDFNRSGGLRTGSRTIVAKIDEIVGTSFSTRSRLLQPDED